MIAAGHAAMTSPSPSQRPGRAIGPADLTGDGDHHVACLDAVGVAAWPLPIFGLRNSIASVLDLNWRRGHRGAMAGQADGADRSCGDEARMDDADNSGFLIEYQKNTCFIASQEIAPVSIFPL